MDQFPPSGPSRYREQWECRRDDGIANILESAAISGVNVPKGRSESQLHVDVLPRRKAQLNQRDMAFGDLSTRKKGEAP
jgi:hypothetical protein